MTVTDRTDRVLEVQFDGSVYPAEDVGHGAAFELYSDRPGTGFLPNPRPGARWPFRRFVHSSDIAGVRGPVTRADDEPLVMPVSRVMTWSAVHRMSQSPHHAGAIAPIRDTGGGPARVTTLSAHCVERGLYEVWAPASEVADAHEADFWYEV